MLGFNELQSSSTTPLHSQSSQVMENEGFLSTPQENHEKQSPTHPEPTLASTLRSCLGVFARNLLEDKNPRAAEQALQEFGMDGSLIPLDPSGAAAVAAASPTKPCSPNRDSLGISLGKSLPRALSAPHFGGKALLCCTALSSTSALLIPGKIKPNQL